MEGKFSHWSSESRKFITKSRSILRKYGVSIQGDHNVVWTPNEGHSVKYAEDVYKRLARADEKGSKENVIAALKSLGKKLGEEK
jgi:hypothetical protein